MARNVWDSSRNVEKCREIGGNYLELYVSNQESILFSITPIYFALVVRLFFIESLLNVFRL